MRRLRDYERGILPDNFSLDTLYGSGSFNQNHAPAMRVYRNRLENRDVSDGSLPRSSGRDFTRVLFSLYIFSFIYFWFLFFVSVNLKFSLVFLSVVPAFLFFFFFSSSKQTSQQFYFGGSGCSSFFFSKTKGYGMCDSSYLGFVLFLKLNSPFFCSTSRSEKIDLFLVPAPQMILYLIRYMSLRDPLDHKKRKLKSPTMEMMKMESVFFHVQCRSRECRVQG